MPNLAVSTVLKREHHEIDCVIETFVEELELGYMPPEALTAALDALRRHIYVEEVFLFPPIRQAGMVMPAAAAAELPSAAGSTRTAQLQGGAGRLSAR